MKPVRTDRAGVRQVFIKVKKSCLALRRIYSLGAERLQQVLTAFAPKNSRHGESMASVNTQELQTSKEETLNLERDQTKGETFGGLDVVNGHDGDLPVV